MKNVIHLISFFLLLASVILACNGCGEELLGVALDSSVPATEALEPVADSLLTGRVRSDAKFFLATSAAVLELLAAVVGTLVAKKKIKAKTTAITELVTGIQSIKKIDEKIYQTVKLHQSVTQSPVTRALVAIVKSKPIQPLCSKIATS